MNTLKLKEQDLRFDSDRHWYYLNGKYVAGVTSILSATIPKGFLTDWAVKMAAEAVVGLFKPNVKYDKATIAAYADLAKNAYKLKRDTAANTGSGLHSILDVYVNSGIEPVIEDSETANSFREFKEWRKNYNPEFLETERKMASSEHNFAGCADAVVKIKDEVYLIDYKSSTGEYNDISYNLQLTAYQMMFEELGYHGINKRALLYLPKTGSGYRFKVVESSFFDDREMFLNLLESYRYFKKWEKG